MQQPNDISSLYQEFGGKPDTYRELTRSREADVARGRWPLINALETLPQEVPSVRPGEAAGAPPPQWQTRAPVLVQATQPPAAAPAALAAPVTPPAQITPVVPAAPVEQRIEPRLDAAPAGVTPAWLAGHTVAAVAQPAPAVAANPAPAVLQEPTTPVAAFARQAAPWGAAAPAWATNPVAAAAAPASPAPAALPIAAPAAALGATPVASPVAAPSAWSSASPSTPVPAQTVAELEGPSPLARLAQPCAPATGLRQVFARLLGTRNNP